MNSIKLQLTAQTPSCFGTPISGHAFGAFAPAGDSRIAATTLVRERVVLMATTGGAKGDLGMTQPYFPGTHAWRPPIC